MQKGGHMRKKQLEENRKKIESNWKRFEKVKDFVQNNRSEVENIQHAFLAKLMPIKTVREKLRILFLDSMNAAGGNNLKLIGASAKKFFEMTVHFGDTQKISMKEFYQIFDDKITSPTTFFKTISAKKFKLGNFREKKTALFMKQIHILHTKGEPQSHFINDYSIQEKDLMIPVDVVIETVLNRIWETNLNASRHFDFINEISKEKLEDNFMLIEDLWFWGFFNTRSQKGEPRKISKELNEDKYYSADFIYPNDDLKSKLEEFSKLLNEL